MSKKYLLIVIILLLILLIGLASYYFFIVNAGEKVENISIDEITQEFNENITLTGTKDVPLNEIEEQFQKDIESLNNLFGDDL